MYFLLYFFDALAPLCSQKKKLAAWLVSHCDAVSERDVFVETLQRYIPVDVFGSCSGRPCPDTPELSCRDYLGHNYKFYLAFENSLCDEYVTEKFFLAYNHNMVPVTFGWANYSLYGPPGSYINALDFESVQDLAQYLQYLDMNDEEYLKYFSWKGKYNVQSYDVKDMMCTICQSFKNVARPIPTYPPSSYYTSPTKKERRYKSFKRWYAALPDGKTTEQRRIGKTRRINVTSICVTSDTVPALRHWIRGG